MPDRRTVVRAFAAASSAGATAGCARLAARLRPPPEPPAFAAALHRPDVTEMVDGVDGDADRRFTFAALRPAAILDRTEALLSAAGDRWRDPGIVQTRVRDRTRGLAPAAEIDRLVLVTDRVTGRSPAPAVEVRAALAGSFDPAAAREQVRSADGARVVDTHRGHDLLAFADRPVAYAVGEGRILRAAVGLADASGLASPLVDRLVATIDVLAGERPPAHDRDGDLRPLVGHLGEGLAVRGSLPPGPGTADLEGLVGAGVASVAVEDLRQRWVGVFDGSVPGDALERRLAADHFLAMADLERRGRVAVAEGTVDLPVWLA